MFDQDVNESKAQYLSTVLRQQDPVSKSRKLGLHLRNDLDQLLLTVNPGSPYRQVPFHLRDNEMILVNGTKRVLPPDESHTQRKAIKFSPYLDRKRLRFERQILKVGEQLPKEIMPERKNH